MVRIRRKNNIEEYGIFLDKSSPLPLVPFGAGLETPAGGTIEGILDANVPYDVLASVCAQNVKKRGAEAMSTFKLAMTHDLSWPNVEHYTELRRRELGTGEDEMTIAERVEYFSTGGYMPAYEIAAFSRVKDTDPYDNGIANEVLRQLAKLRKGHSRPEKIRSKPKVTRVIGDYAVFLTKVDVGVLVDAKDRKEKTVGVLTSRTAGVVDLGRLKEQSQRDAAIVQTLATAQPDDYDTDAISTLRTYFDEMLAKQHNGLRPSFAYPLVESLYLHREIPYNSTPDSND